MDVNAILEIFEEKKLHYITLSGEELIRSLNVMEYIDIEDKKCQLFINRIEFICMSNCLKIAMERESGYKQLKRYFSSECGMTDAVAKQCADKYNEGNRIYNKFPLIVNNCTQCHGIDIRDLTVKELSLAVNMSWLIRRAALTKSKQKAVPQDVAVDVDFMSVQQSVEQILASNWYSVARENPALVANIMNQISDRVVSTSQYSL